MSENIENGIDTTIYKVIVKVEEETDRIDFSIWPVDRTNPMGWKDIKKTGTKQECINYVDKVRSKQTFS